jgi:hypothetical protein
MNDAFMDHCTAMHLHINVVGWLVDWLVEWLVGWLVVAGTAG